MAFTLTVLSLLVAAYRLWRRQFTSGEWVLLALFVVHCLLTQGQLLVDTNDIWYFDERYTNPAYSLTWGWLAWALVKAWSHGVRVFRWRVQVRHAVLAGIACLGFFAVYKCVRGSFPWTRRGRSIAMCRWAAEEIRNDWKGPDRDTETPIYLSDYHLPYRPIVSGGSGYLAYLVGGRATHPLKWRRNFPRPEVPDYWVSTSNAEKDQPPDEIPYDKLCERTFRRKHVIIYKRSDLPHGAEFRTP